MKGQHRHDNSDDVNLDDVKRYYPLRSYFEDTLGVTFRRNVARCPFHDDATPSLSLYEYEGIQFWKCHAGCGEGTIIDAVQRGEGLDTGDATARAKELYREFAGGSPRLILKSAPPQPATLTDENVAALGEAQERLERLTKTPAVLERYGLTIDDAVRYGLGVDSQKNLLIPLYDRGDGHILNVKKRSARGRSYAYIQSGLGAPAWLSPNIDEAEVVVVTEGELNAITAHAARPDYAYIGMSGAGQSLDRYAEHLQGRDVIINVDDDEAGHKALAQWLEAARSVARFVEALEPNEFDFADIARDQGRDHLNHHLLVHIAELLPDPTLQGDKLGFKPLDLSAPIKPVSWVVEEMIQRRKINFIAGDGSAGKSMFMAYLAVCVAAGRPLFGSQKRPTMGAGMDIRVIDYEEDDDDAYRRWVKFTLNAFGLKPEDIKMPYHVLGIIDPRWRGKSFPDMVPLLVDDLAGSESLIILDAFEVGMQVNSNDAQEVTAALTAAKYLCYHGHTVIILDHLPKLVAGAQRRSLEILGSKHKKNQARAVWIVDDVTPEHALEDKGVRVLEFRASKLNSAAKPAPFGVKRYIDMEAQTLRFEESDLPDDDASSGLGRPSNKSERQTALLELVRSRAERGETTSINNATDIISEFDVDRKTVQRDFTDLVKRGLLEAKTLPGMATDYRVKGD